MKHQNRPGLIIQFLLFLFAAILALMVIYLNQGTSSEVPQGKGSRADFNITSLFKPNFISDAFRKKLLYSTPYYYPTPLIVNPSPESGNVPINSTPNNNAPATPTTPAPADGQGVDDIQYTTPPADGQLIPADFQPEIIF